MPEERISELEDKSIETPKIEMQREKKKKAEKKSCNYKTISKVVICIVEIPRWEEEGSKIIFEIIMAENFPKFTTKTKSQIHKNSENIKQATRQKNLYPGMAYSNCRKPKTRRRC